MTPKLSFILPCYNVAKYVERCLASIFASGLSESDFEVICINDCSKDSTLSILQQVASKHHNMSIINFPKNEGLSIARNTGLNAARGEYIWFVDSDDTIEPQNVKNLLDHMVNAKLDVLLFNYTDLNEDGSIIPPVRLFEDSIVMSGEKFVDALFGDSIVYYMGYVVRFMVRKQYLIDNNIIFPEKKHWEDTVWMPKVLLLADRVKACSLCGYYYWHHASSICGRFDNSLPAQLIYERCFDVTKQLLDFADELNLHKYSEVFRLAAKKMYLNKLPLYLCRASKVERKLFYKIISTKNIKTFRREMTLLTRLLVQPYIGPFLVSIMAFIYKHTH